MLTETYLIFARHVDDEKDSAIDAPEPKLRDIFERHNVKGDWLSFFLPSASLPAGMPIPREPDVSVCQRRILSRQEAIDALDELQIFVTNEEFDSVFRQCAMGRREALDFEVSCAVTSLLLARVPDVDRSPV
jgi:hypothetical protein